MAASEGFEDLPTPLSFQNNVNCVTKQPIQVKPSMSYSGCNDMIKKYFITLPALLKISTQRQLINGIKF